MGGDADVSQYHDIDEFPLRRTDEENSSKELNTRVQLGVKLKNQNISTESIEEPVKQNRCRTCDAIIGDARRYREHSKTDWHKHNLRRKTRQLPPLSAEECMADMELSESKEDLKEYSF